MRICTRPSSGTVWTQERSRGAPAPSGLSSGPERVGGPTAPSGLRSDLCDEGRRRLEAARRLSGKYSGKYSEPGLAGGQARLTGPGAAGVAVTEERPPGALACVVEQLLGAARVAQLGERLLLQLADPLPGQSQRLADLIERVRVAVIETEPHRHDRGLARRQRIQRVPQLVGHQLAVNQLAGLRRVDVLDQVADAGLAVLADRRVEADRLPAGAQQLLDLVRRPVQLDGQLLRGWLPAQALVHVALDPGQLAEHLEHVHRQPDGPGRVGEAALDGLPDPPHRVRRELVALGVVELLDRPDQAQVAFLH